MSKNENTEKTRELTEAELNAVSGGKTKPDGTAGGNVAGGWDLIANKVHA